MAVHLFIAGTIISVCFGAGLFIYINSMKKDYRDETLHHLGRYIIYFNIVMVILLTVEYLKTNLELPGDDKKLIASIFGDACLIFWPLIYTSILGTLLVLLKSKHARTIGTVNLIVLVVMVLIIILKNFFFYEDKISLFNSLYDSIGIGIDLLEILTLVYFLLVSIRLTDGDRKVYQSSFGWLFLVRYVFDILMFYIPIYVFNFKYEYFISFAAGSTLFVFNMMPLIWLKYYFKPYQEKNKPVEGIVFDESIAEQYGVSPREKEIIILILEGKSNRDIKEKLFLSDHTVKNHIYKIYKKLNISSRYELIALFRS